MIYRSFPPSQTQGADSLIILPKPVHFIIFLTWSFPLNTEATSLTAWLRSCWRPTWPAQLSAEQAFITYSSSCSLINVSKGILRVFPFFFFMFPLDAEYSPSDIPQDGEKLDSRTLITIVIACIQTNHGPNQITKYITAKKNVTSAWADVQNNSPNSWPRRFHWIYFRTFCWHPSLCRELMSTSEHYWWTCPPSQWWRKEVNES